MADGVMKVMRIYCYKTDDAARLADLLSERVEIEWISMNEFVISEEDYEECKNIIDSTADVVMPYSPVFLF